jgi:hypothetical protein
MRHVVSDAVMDQARHIICRKLRFRIPDRRLRRLQRELFCGVYQFHQTEWRLTEEGREVAILIIEDRIVAAALALVLEWLWRSHRHEGTFAWGRRRGVHQALRYLCRNIHEAMGYDAGDLRFLELFDRPLRAPEAQGDVYVLHNDIYHAFQETPHELVMEQLRQVVSDEAVLRLVQSYLANVATSVGAGIGQGTHLAPTLCDITYDAIDREIAATRSPSTRRSGTKETANAIGDMQVPADASSSADEYELVKDWDLWPLLTHCSQARRRSPNSTTDSGVQDRGEEGATTIRSRCPMRYGDNLLQIVTISGPDGRSEVDDMGRECEDFLLSLGLSANESKKHLDKLEKGFDFLGLHISIRQNQVHRALTEDTARKHLVKNVDKRLHKLGVRNPSFVQFSEAVVFVVTHVVRYYRSAGVTDMEPLIEAAWRYEAEWLEARMNEEIV